MDMCKNTFYSLHTLEFTWKITNHSPAKAVGALVRNEAINITLINSVAIAEATIPVV